MHTNSITGFRHSTLHTLREPHAVFYLKQQTSFWIAVLTVFTFLAGNMVGRHGWYAFWASVMGKEDYSAIVYQGTALPVAQVVDYGCWAQYGGDYKVHTFRQAPSSCHRPVPSYSVSPDRHELFSMQHMSSYSETTEGSGTHNGVDIRLPIGTPVLATMNAVVHAVGDQSKGFGKYVVLLHPNVPDPKDPSKVTTVYTTYGHLSAVYVGKGDVVRKGDEIALSGNTGNTTGPHLHFQMDREEAPWIPYSPSSASDGQEYTVHPMLYVQSNYAGVPQKTLVADASGGSTVTSPAKSSESILTRLLGRRERRMTERLAQRNNRTIVAGLQTGVSEQVIPAAPAPVVGSETEQVSDKAGVIQSVEIVHDGIFTSRGWEKVVIRLLDADGNIVTSPELKSDVAVRVTYGEAEIRPANLSAKDFVNGEATVNVLPQNIRTVVLTVLPFHSVSKPLEYRR